MKISFKAPITLLLVAGSLAVTLAPGMANLLAITPAGITSWLNPMFYLGLIGHIFAHSGIAHWANNMALILLLAPAIERKLGALEFSVSLIVLTLLIGACESFVLTFTGTRVIGASDLVFAFIIMSTFSESQKGEIPVTSILVAVLWGIHELGGLFTKDTIANSAHLVGAVWGFIWGFFLLPKGEDLPMNPTPAN